MNWLERPQFASEHPPELHSGSLTRGNGTYIPLTLINTAG